MKLCPHCGAEYIEGADMCDDCQHSLTDMSYPNPKSTVEKGLLKDRIESLSPKKPLTAEVGTSVGDVLKQMVEADIGCVIVVQGDQIAGIFSERDALLKINAEVDGYADQAIETLMTPKPETLDAEDKIAFALHKMHVGGYRHIPITQDNALLGVISIRDILEYLAQRINNSQ